MPRAPLRIPRPRDHPGTRAGGARAHRGLRAVRRHGRIRNALPQVRPGQLPRAGRTTRAEAPDPARAVRRVKWLTADGLAAALVVGGGVAAGFEWSGLLLLFAFFLSGSLLTQWSGGPAGRRTARQVPANGGGRGPAGTSGGITVLGTAGGVAGGLLIATLATTLGPAPWVVVAVAGTAGMAADSLCGAALQGAFECASCGERHERPDTLCHEPVKLIRGWRWLDNDGGDWVATLLGEGVAMLAGRLDSWTEADLVSGDGVPGAREL